MLSDSYYSDDSDLDCDASTDQELAFESLDSRDEPAQGERAAWTVLEAADLARVQARSAVDQVVSAVVGMPFVP